MFFSPRFLRTLSHSSVLAIDTIIIILMMKDAKRGRNGHTLDVFGRDWTEFYVGQNCE